MNPARWEEIERLYHSALEISESERAQFLRQESRGDAALESEVASLLAQPEEDFLESPALEIAARTLATATPALPPRIGRYRIIRLLGEGGMGTVYEAEQDQPRRIVALKVIKPGLATPDRLRRFIQESLALARLQHPGIAQIYDSDTADFGLGEQPYFAMEFIRGIPLQDYAARLPFREKFALIAKICDAVHHAHLRGLIHRDLKPGNILVDEAGQPKVLDFGIARATTADAEAAIQTDAGQLVGTLAYMSPEQLAGDVDPRSDVYSLGVILYLLLAQRLPNEVSRRQLPEAVQAIRDEEPATLGSIDRKYRGDIETIAGKALEKDKSRRYASAAEVAADIQRYLNDEPIAARPPSSVYRLKKFTSRHRSLVASLAISFVVLAAGVAISTSQAIRASKARMRAEAAERTATEDRNRALSAESAASDERNRAVAAQDQAIQERNRAMLEKRRADEETAVTKAVNDFLRNDLLAQASPSRQARPGTRPDPDLKVRTALDRAAAGIAGRFDTQPLVEASIRQTIGNTYMDLGLYPEAQIQIERTLEIRRRLLGEDHPETLLTLNNLAALCLDQGKRAEAEPLLLKVLEIGNRTVGKENPSTLVTLNNLAGLYRMEGKYAQAERIYAQSLEIRRRVLGENDRSTALTMHNLASLYRLEGKYAEAEPLQIKAVEVWRAVLGEEAPETLQGMNNLAALYRAEDKFSNAENIWSKVLEGRRRTLGAQHPSVVDTMVSLGEVRLQQNEFALAESLLRAALDTAEKTAPEGWQRYASEVLLGASLAGQQRSAEADRLLTSGERGLRSRESAIPPDSRRLLDQAAGWRARFYTK